MQQIIPNSFYRSSPLWQSVKCSINVPVVANLDLGKRMKILFSAIRRCRILLCVSRARTQLIQPWNPLHKPVETNLASASPAVTSQPTLCTFSRVFGFNVENKFAITIDERFMSLVVSERVCPEHAIAKVASKIARTISVREVLLELFLGSHDELELVLWTGLLWSSHLTKVVASLRKRNEGLIIQMREDQFFNVIAQYSK